jgi:hypothetical protein
MDLALIPINYPGVDCVNISFAQPDSLYKGNSFDGTGLQFSQDFSVVKQAIQLLTTNGVTVMLSVGGGAYWSDTKNFNTQNLISLADDLGCSGIDLDWEVGADKAYELTEAIRMLRGASYKGKISFAGWSTGAYGVKKGNTYQGMNINAMTEQGSNVDWINIMTYDAGPAFDPLGSFNCYREYYRGPLNIGFEVGTQGWGGYLLTYDDVARMAFYAHNENPLNGAFIWSLLKPGQPSVSEIVSTCKNIFVKPKAPPPPVVQPEAPPPYKIECPVCKSNFILQK